MQGPKNLSLSPKCILVMVLILMPNLCGFESKC